MPTKRLFFFLAMQASPRYIHSCPVTYQHFPAASSKHCTKLSMGKNLYTSSFWLSAWATSECIPNSTHNPQILQLPGNHALQECSRKIGCEELHLSTLGIVTRHMFPRKHSKWLQPLHQEVVIRAKDGYWFPKFIFLLYRPTHRDGIVTYNKDKKKKATCTVLDSSKQGRAPGRRTKGP